MLLVFIGGFSAAAGMMMVSSMTLATMTTNHLLLPVLDRLRQLSFLRRYLLQCKWAAVAGVLLLGWWFKDWVGASQMLVDIGMIAFAAAMQFAPAILGGLFWRHGNTAGASLGLASGFLSGSTRCSFLCLSGAVGLMSRCSAAGHGVSGGFARSSHRLGWNNDARGWGVHPCLWCCPSRVEDRSRV